jgi:hypothetical protein
VIGVSALQFKLQLGGGCGVHPLHSVSHHRKGNFLFRTRTG